MHDTLHESPLPSSPRHVGLYIMHLHTLGLQASTLRTHLSAIAFTHRLHDQVDPTSTFTIEKLMTSLKHASSPRVRLPITLNILKKVIKNISELYGSRYQRRLYTALFVSMYHACLRVSEVAIAKHNRHTLEFADVKCRNKYVVINFRTFKHSKGQTASLKIAATHDVCCPVSALSKYLSKRGTVSGPIFIKENGKPLTRSNVASALQQCLRPTVRNPERYNTHSFRIGKITDLACAGYSNAKMKKIGRWRSSTAMQRYIKPTLVHVP